MRPVGDHSSPSLPHSQLYWVVASPRSAGKGGRGWAEGEGGGSGGGGAGKGGGTGGGEDATGGGGEARTTGGGGKVRGTSGGGKGRKPGGGGDGGDRVGGGDRGGGLAAGGSVVGAARSGGEGAARGGGDRAAGGLPAGALQGPLTQNAGLQAGLVPHTPCEQASACGWVGGGRSTHRCVQLPCKDRHETLPMMCSRACQQAVAMTASKGRSCRLWRSSRLQYAHSGPADTSGGDRPSVLQYTTDLHDHLLLAISPCRLERLDGPEWSRTSCAPSHCSRSGGRRRDEFGCTVTELLLWAAGRLLQ